MLVLVPLTDWTGTRIKWSSIKETSSRLTTKMITIETRHLRRRIITDTEILTPKKKMVALKLKLIPKKNTIPMTRARREYNPVGEKEKKSIL